ncbi:hypothetical protein [Caldimonas sp. KR1-144]|uniref:hypothetical protein n=1 Tax=Caldimonas sp. KR1-144 TaxID=3400911 RepID=UPI003C2CE1CE
MVFEPERFLPALASSVRLMHANRRALRLAPGTDFVVKWLASLLVEAIEGKKRFRTLDCLRTVRSTIRNAPPGQTLEPSTVGLLFRLYQHFVGSSNPDIQWCVGAFIRDRELSEDQLAWLIAAAPDSTHALNRLLRYPKRNRQIVAWARAAYEGREHPDRTAEILGLLIDSKVPPQAREEPTDTVLWAIFYSHTDLRTKERLLLRHVKRSSAESAIKLALRLGLPSLLHRLSKILSREGGDILE